MTTTEDAPDRVVVSTVPHARRGRSPGDVVRLFVGALLVVGGALLARVAQATIQGIEIDLLRAVARLPLGVGELLLSLAQLVTGLVAPVTLVVLLVRRRWRAAVLLVAAASLASLVMTVADAIVLDRDLGAALAAAEAGNTLADPAYPNSNAIAALTAVVTVSAPWLGVRWKRTLWGGVGALLFLRLVSLAPALDLVLALGVGTVVGSALLVAVGTPVRYAAPHALVRAVRAAGVDLRRLRQPERHATTLRYHLTDRGGRDWTAVLRTPDERDAELLNRLYRRVRYRSSEVSATYQTVKRRIEHEVLVMALAERAGVRAPAELRVGETDDGSAFYLTPRQRLRPASEDDLRRTGFLSALWAQVDALHGAGLAHRALAREAIRVDDAGQPHLTEFDSARTAPSERERARDIAQLLTETAVVVGPDEAVTAAVAALGPDEVAGAMRMLQPLALRPSTRRRTGKVDALLDDLRTAVTRATGSPDVELEDLERVKPRTLLIIIASALAFYTLLPQLSDFGDTIDAFADADPLWLVGALAASAVTYVFAAVSLQGAVADPLPFVPNVRAQVAASFTALVGPAGAGGFALTGRFLQRAGVGPAEAGASVAVNAIAGFIVHVSLVAGFIVWAGNTSLGSFSLPDSTTVLLVLAAVLALIGVLAAVRPVRRRVLVPAIATARTGLAQIGRVFTSPQRVIALFGGSVGISFTYVIAITATLEAFGGGLTLPQIGAAYLAAVAIATLAPTPGGLGALESAMIAGFTGFGLDSGVAVSATLTFRLLTFWLPVLPGWLAFNWMQRNDEI